MENNQTVPSGFKTPITIHEAIINIERNKYLLPAIQRKFVWSSEQIEVLFDSIMRGYPINSFMFWNVKDKKIKNDYKFYEFLKEYRAFFKEENPFIDTTGWDHFYAIIDGQQRLTSIYIGLKGSYAYKMPRKWLKDNEECLPTRKLYINLSSSLKDDERKMIYDFKFLSENDVKSKGESEDLFLINDIYRYYDPDDLEEYMGNQKWIDSSFAKKTLRQLRKVVFEKPLINYYQEETQNIDIVLDVFIRTNSGGEPLSFSNLLMSITTAYWQKDARKEFKSLINSIYTNNFIISADLILKCCLVLFVDNIKFQIANFDTNNISIFENNWERIKKCIETSFELLKIWGFNDSSFRAKNAIIPIVYYIYHHNLEEDILKDNKHLEEKKEMRKWLCISLLKGVFGGQSDNVLTGIRKVLIANKKKEQFPFEEIKKEFASNDAKSLSFSDEVIEDILKTQKDAPNCYAILALLYSGLQYDKVTYHKDHLHPASMFEKLKKEDIKDDDTYEFYSNRENWNSVLNLQLLSGTANESKSNEPLAEWVSKKSIDRALHLIPDNASLDFKDFKNFIEQRKVLLTKTIKTIIGDEPQQTNDPINYQQPKESIEENLYSSDLFTNADYVLVEYTPKYDSWLWKGTLILEINLTTKSLKWRNGSFGRWDLTHEQETEYYNFFSNQNNLQDFFDDSKAYNTDLDRSNINHPTTYELKITWNNQTKQISVGSPDIPYKHPWNKT